MITRTMEQRLLELEGRVAKLEEMSLLSRIERVRPSVQKKMSAKEFLLAKELKTEVQKTLALGYFLERMEGVSSFNIDDLVAAFRTAMEKRPTNMNDTVNKNVARGLLMAATEKKDSKKAWVLTSTGEKYVEEELNK